MNSRTLLITLFSFILIGYLFGCGGDDPVSPGGDPPATGTTVGAQGGTFAFAGGTVTLTVPASAVAADIEVAVAAQSTFPADTGYVSGTCYEFSPDGQQFLTPVTLKIRYNESNLPAGVTEASLELCKIVSGSWQSVGGFAVNTDSNWATAPISSFSSYGVVGSVAASGLTYTGDYVIYDSTTLANFQDYVAITGELEIASQGPDSVVLPNLVTVGGDLNMYGSPQAAHNLKAVNIPALTSISHQLRIYNCDSLLEVNLPQCASAGSIIVEYNGVLRNLNGLSGLRSINPTDMQYYGGISFRANDSLLNFDGLSGITGTTSSITIAENRSLLSVAGLSGITLVEGDLDITDNRELTTLAGLTVSQVNGYCFVRNDNVLATLSGLDRLHTVGRSLQVEACPLLTDLTGLGSLTNVQGLSIKYNDGLITLDGLGLIQSLSHSLWIEYCDELEDIEALGTLQTIDGPLGLRQLYSLESLAGLEALTHISGALRLNHMTALRNLDPLSNLDHAWDAIIINNCWHLTSVQGLWGLQQNPATGYVCTSLYIEDNATGGGDPSHLTDDAAWELVEKIGGAAMVRDTIIIQYN